MPSTCVNFHATQEKHVYEVRSRRDKRGIDLISDELPFGRLWYRELNPSGNAVDYAKYYSCSHGAVIRVYNGPGNVIKTREHKGHFKEPWTRVQIGKVLVSHVTQMCDNYAARDQGFRKAPDFAI